MLLSVESRLLIPLWVRVTTLVNLIDCSQTQLIIMQRVDDSTPMEQLDEYRLDSRVMIKSPAMDDG